MSAGVPLSSLRVGDRIDPARATLKIPELAASILRHGLIKPLATTPERGIIDGVRRRAALELLEQQGHAVPALIRVMATAKGEQAQLDIEFEANAQAEPWSLQARWEYYRRCKAREQEAARKRMAQGGREKGGPADPPLGDEPQPKAGRAEEIAAKAAGLSRTSARRLDDIMTAAEADPELAPLRDEVVATGRINAVHRKLQRAQATGRMHDPDGYCTQQWILGAIHQVEPDGIALDPCSNALAVELGFVDACVSWTIADDARRQPTWRVCELHHTPVGGRRRDKRLHGRYVVFFQPPYSSPDQGDKQGAKGPDDPGCPGLTSKLCEEWDAGRLDRVYALVKDDASTEWWALLRDRAAVLIKPRDRLAHVIGRDANGEPIEHAGSDFNSAIHVLARGTRAELLQLWRELIAAFGDQADVYLSPNVLEAERQPAATSSPTTPTTSRRARR